MQLCWLWPPDWASGLLRLQDDCLKAHQPQLRQASLSSTAIASPTRMALSSPIKNAAKATCCSVQWSSWIITRAST